MKLRHKILIKLYIMIAILISVPILNFDDTAYADDLNGWESVQSATFDYWVKKFSLHTGHRNEIEIGDTFLEGGKVYQFPEIDPIYGLTVGGSIEMHSEKSLVRIILVTHDLKEHLVYEAYPLIVKNHSYSIEDVCEETCILDSMNPYAIRLDLVDAAVTIKNVSYVDSSSAVKEDIESMRRQVKRNQDAVKVELINSQDLTWTAGETYLSRLTFEEKRNLFRNGKVPNLQGAEFYKGGIFEIKSGDSPPSSSSSIESSLTESFDWRNRHGADDPDSPYYDGDPVGSGWITTIKNQGGYPTCWPFSATGAVEALANLYFNQHLDLDLSEQDVISCRYAGTINYFSTDGVVDENCFPYSGAELPCENKCLDPDDLIQLSGHVDFEEPKTDEKLKGMIIDYGSLSGGIYSWNHAMTLVGYEKDHGDGETIWIFKNSWGSSWGDHGYGYIKTDIHNIGWTNAFLLPVKSKITPYEIRCYDKDGDGYYNWGISKDKPSSCAKKGYSEKDCDDSNPDLGPFAADGSCVEISIKNLLWQDQHNGKANGDDVANAIAVESSRIFVAGKVSNQAKGDDFAVRTYNVK